MDKVIAMVDAVVNFLDEAEVKYKLLINNEDSGERYYLPIDEDKVNDLEDKLSSLTNNEISFKIIG